MSVWGVRLFCLLFTWEEWWLNFRGSTSIQQLYPFFQQFLVTYIVFKLSFTYFWNFFPKIPSIFLIFPKNIFKLFWISLGVSHWSFPKLFRNFYYITIAMFWNLILSKIFNEVIQIFLKLSYSNSTIIDLIFPEIFPKSP